MEPKTTSLIEEMERFAKALIDESSNKKRPYLKATARIDENEIGQALTPGFCYLERGVKFLFDAWINYYEQQKPKIEGETFKIEVVYLTNDEASKLNQEMIDESCKNSG